MGHQQTEPDTRLGPTREYLGALRVWVAFVKAGTHPTQPRLADWELTGVLAIKRSPLPNEIKER